MPIDFPFRPGIKPCPICKTEDEGPAIFVPIDGTLDGSSWEALQVHIKCIADTLIYFPVEGFMAIGLKQI